MDGVTLSAVWDGGKTACLTGGYGRMYSALRLTFDAKYSVFCWFSVAGSPTRQQETEAGNAHSSKLHITFLSQPKMLQTSIEAQIRIQIMTRVEFEM
jgi:hypothetical protein